jgi:DNA polymerase-3 subunit alpha
MCVMQLSDASGQYEAVMFSETLAQYRDLIEPGRSVVITVAAEDRPEGVNLRVQTMQSLEEQASQMQRAMRVFLRDPEPVQALTRQLGQKGEGQVSFVVIRPDNSGEIEIELPDRYRVEPRIASALKAIKGVVDVELV